MSAPIPDRKEILQEYEMTNYQDSDTRVHTQKKTRRVFLVHPPKNPAKSHLKSNCIVLFNNMFRYFEVLKPISRTLLNIFRYSKVLVSILKPKTQKGLAAFVYLM